LLRQAITEIRRRTRAGTIHLNTNGFCPSALRELAGAGLDSVRVSLNSLCEKDYDSYYRPRGYGLADVLASLAAARRSGLFVSLNLLTFPGFTDDKEEVLRLLRFLKKGHVDLLQLRNLSIDPELFSRRFSLSRRRPIGLARMIGLIRRQYPSLRLGYFNPPKEGFRA
jgi:molybdenum cofactor biosynthesis enzyme MoaA